MAELTPGQRHTRIRAIDALRGFALVGILFVNLVHIGGPIDADAPASPPSLANADWQVWWASHLFVHGSMRGLFSMLFGASTLLFLREGARSGAFLKRSGWLFVFGAVNATFLLWPGDILLIYGLAGPLVLLLSKARPRTQLTAAFAILLCISVWSYLRAVASASAADAADPTSAAMALAEESAARLGSYAATLQFMWKTSLDWTLDPMTLWWVLDASAFMLLGMALFQLKILDATAPTQTYASMALLGFALGLPLRAWETSTAFGNGGEFLPAARATYQFGRLLISLGWLGGFMLAWRTIQIPGLFAPLTALGRTALSGYLAQSAIAATIFSGFGLGLWNRLSWPLMWMLVPAIMLVLALLATLWLRHFRFGPVEWLLRSLVFGRSAARRNP